MEDQGRRDVPPTHYAAVIRDLIRGANDVTNHRLMWLLIIQGLLANAYVGLRQIPHSVIGLSAGAILVCLSAFHMLYRSYQARGYLSFLGIAAKGGTLQEQHLPVAGWPGKRIKDWRSRVWVCPWLARVGDLLDPCLFLPASIVALWCVPLLRNLTSLGPWAAVGASVGLSLILMSALCIAWVRSERKSEQESPEAPAESCDARTMRHEPANIVNWP